MKDCVCIGVPKELLWWAVAISTSGYVCGTQTHHECAQTILNVYSWAWLEVLCLCGDEEIWKLSTQNQNSERVTGIWEWKQEGPTTKTVVSQVSWGLVSTVLGNKHAILLAQHGSGIQVYVYLLSAGRLKVQLGVSQRLPERNKQGRHTLLLTESDVRGKKKTKPAWSWKLAWVCTQS